MSGPAYATFYTFPSTLPRNKGMKDLHSLYIPQHASYQGSTPTTSPTSSVHSESSSISTGMACTSDAKDRAETEVEAEDAEGVVWIGPLGRSA